MMSLLHAEKRSPYSDSQSQWQDQYIYDSTQANMPKPPWSRLRRVIIVIIFLISSSFILLRYNGMTVWNMAGSGDLKDPSTKLEILEKTSVPLHPNTNGSALVPLEAHIMSKCPDARDCLRDLIVPAMEKISDKVDFRLSFIGTVVGDNDVHCMHGPSECLGNIISLCAISLFPNNAVVSLGFTNCLLRSYSRIPVRDLVQTCASEHGIEFNALNACISDDEGKGMNLLQESIERSEKANVKRSCTVRVRHKTWCVRDGGEWKDCPNGSSVDDLIAEILNGES